MQKNWPDWKNCYLRRRISNALVHNSTIMRTYEDCLLGTLEAGDISLRVVNDGPYGYLQQHNAQAAAAAAASAQAHFSRPSRFNGDATYNCDLCHYDSDYCIAYNAVSIGIICSCDDCSACCTCASDTGVLGL